jgi:hypothetical protein
VLPDVMESQGFPQLTLEDGSTLEIKDELFTTLNKDKREEAMAEIERLGRGDIISTEVTVRFAKGEREALKRFVDLLRKSVRQWPLRVTPVGAIGEELPQFVAQLVREFLPERTIEVTDSVHGGTLKAFVKQQLTLGTTFDAELFGAVRVHHAVIKPPKAVKTSLDDSAETQINQPNPSTALHGESGS